LIFTALHDASYNAYDGVYRRFSGDESFLKDPNAFNDTINEQAAEGEGTIKKGQANL